MIAAPHSWRPWRLGQTIGSASDPYMLRWYIIPRNRWFNVYLHHFMRSDDDRALHDHPWWNVSILLTGRYLEHMPGRVAVRRPFLPVARRATDSHRIELVEGPIWTIFITGPHVRDWGFWCPQGWRHWREFTSERPGISGVGRGCE